MGQEFQRGPGGQILTLARAATDRGGRMARSTAAQWPLAREPKTTEAVCKKTQVVNLLNDYLCEKQ